MLSKLVTYFIYPPALPLAIVLAGSYGAATLIAQAPNELVPSKFVECLAAAAVITVVVLFLRFLASEREHSRRQQTELLESHAEDRKAFHAGIQAVRSQNQGN